MGQNWELVSDAINSIVQFKVFFFCDKQTFCYITCFVISLKHALCIFYLEHVCSIYFRVVVQCKVLSMFASVMCASFAVAMLLLLSGHSLRFSCGIIFYHSILGHYLSYSPN